MYWFYSLTHSHSDLATEIAANATALRQEIVNLTAEQREVEASTNQTNTLVEGIENAFNQVSEMNNCFCIIDPVQQLLTHCHWWNVIAWSPG